MNTNDFDFEIDDATFKKQLLKLFNGLERLSRECKSQTASELIKACSDNIGKYSGNLDTFTSLYDQYESTYESKYSALEDGIDSHYKTFELIKAENSRDIAPEQALQNMEQELSCIRDLMKNKDQLGKLNDAAIEMVHRVHNVNAEIRNEVKQLAIYSFSSMIVGEGRKFIIGEIAKELDFTFVLKAKSLAERYQKESDKIIINIVEADNSLLNWEKFRDSLCELNSKLTAVNSEIQPYLKS